MNATPPKPPFAVVGLGQLGTALVKAIGRAFPESPIVAIEPDPKARAQALQDRLVGVADETPGPSLTPCGLVFLCVPLGTLPEVLPLLGPHLGPEAIVTDLSPVKGAVASLVEQHLPGVRHVGGHPLVAGEPGSNGKADLFVGRPVALCPRPGQESLAAGVGTVWAAIGARPVVIPADEHDRLIAATAHAPYLASLALIRIAGALDGAERLMAKTFAEALRPAGLSAEAMAAAVGANPFAPAAVRVVADELRRLADLAESDPEGLLAAAIDGRAARARLLSEP
ncbi:prephenate dehydrogenase [Vulgatibacter incomptus]|uniref:Arogenate dehydrogenase n=1 Tax=Vulgatibacter incomptus TaxID=1391653 RepID=A0A0K1PE62_9BACT|nr:prephenate dehydrogenase [Vulgatibacter incomptus]AKU91782.1 Arogenate dehydrogenase [Vulgatibacter incomptus]